ncbi:MAG: hypothetical protein WCY29_16975 [Novosphingobium sp.]
MVIMRIARFTGTSLADIEGMAWDRALAWLPEVIETVQELRRR